MGEEGIFSKNKISLMRNLDFPTIHQIKFSLLYLKSEIRLYVQIKALIWTCTKQRGTYSEIRC